MELKDMSVKLNVDQTKLEEAIEKVNELKEAIYIVRGLLSEIEDMEIEIDIAVKAEHDE